MLLTKNEALLFLRVYQDLVTYGARSAGGIQGIVDKRTWEAAPIAARAEARHYLLDHLDLIAGYVAENPDGLSAEILAQVDEWKHFVRGRFTVERDLAKYTVLLDTSSPARAYAVLGLTTEIVEMLPFDPPVFIEAVLLPWKDVIICDGIISSYNILIGSGMRSGFRDAYRRAKAAGIITSLPPNTRPAETKPRQRPKTPAVIRFLRKHCPRSVDEFVERFGAPRMELADDMARERSVWNLDGTPVLDIDYLMVYANIIKDQILYVYAKDRKIPS